MQKWAEKFYKSKAWEETRKVYYISRFGLCERCGKPGSIVHHKIRLTPKNINNPEITLNWSNLELLCIDCHNKEHSKKLPIAEGLCFDEQGNLVQSEKHTPHL